MNYDLANEGEIDEAEQLLEFARYIGIDPNLEPHLMDIAEEGLTSQTPKNWVHGIDDEGNEYYYNRDTKEYLTDNHPNVEIYRERVLEERQRSKLLN